MSQFITKLKSTQSMQSIPMYTKAGSRLPATPTAEVGRVDLRTPAVMVSPETIGVLVPGSPVAGDRVRLTGAQDGGEGGKPVKGHAPHRLDTNMAARVTAKDGPSIRDRSGTHIAPATSGADVPALLDEAA